MASVPMPMRDADGRIEADRNALLAGGVIAVAFIAAFWYPLNDLAHAWRNSMDWSHGPIIPLFSAYLVYTQWEKVKRCPIKYTSIGLVLLVAGLVLYQISLWWIVIGYIRPASMLLCLLGIIIYLCGLPVVRYVWVPWLYLFFAVPLPKGVYFAITDPLRRIAATITTALLRLVPDLDIERIGSTIEYVYGTRSGHLGVADACSGMRSTITLCAIGVAVAFVSDRPRWQRIVLVASCVPIAVFSNLIRVATTCVLHIFVDPKYAEGDYHTALGLVTMLIAFMMFSGLAWLLGAIFVETPDDEATLSAEPRT
jgi:exosortase